MKTKTLFQIPKLPKEISSTEFFLNQNQARLCLAEWRLKLNAQPGFTVEWIDSDSFTIDSNGFDETHLTHKILEHEINTKVVKF